MASPMVAETWVYVSHYWFSCSTNIRNCWITNRDIKDFLLVNILTNLRRCRLQSKYLEKLIFVSKNWPNDTRVGCKSLSDLIEFIEMNEQLEEELQEFESQFEWEEIFNIIFFHFKFFASN
jgi:hypothetical protein